MTRVRRRLAKDRGVLAYLPPIEVEIEHGPLPELYRWKLSRYLLPHSHGNPVEARSAIETARRHEARMWDLYLDGRASR